MLIALTLVIAAGAGPAISNVAHDQLAAGHNEAAIIAMESVGADRRDPARLINLGIAYAREGDIARARSLFEAAVNSPDRMDLETSDGAWIDSRVLARRAIAMLDNGTFSRAGRIARN